ncbi:hypothetical protein B7463_g2893, partial [Scytalidium lignicola]
MALFDSGQEAPTLRDTYQFWIDETRGREVVMFALYRGNLIDSTAELSNERYIPVGEDYFTDIKNNVFVRNLLASIEPGEQQELPIDIVVQFCLQETFREHYNAVDFNLSLAALDFFQLFELRRSTSVNNATQRLRVRNLRNWRNEYTGEAPVGVWFEVMEKQEIVVATLYSRVFIDLRLWTMIYELKKQPFNKIDVLAMLNSLFLPSLREQSQSRVLPEILYRYHQSFYQLMYSVDANGPRVVDEFINRHLRPGTMHDWVETRRSLQRYFEIGLNMIEQAEKVYGIQYFAPHNEESSSIATPSENGYFQPSVENNVCGSVTKTSSEQGYATSSFLHSEVPHHPGSSPNSWDNEHSNIPKTQVPRVSVNIFNEPVYSATTVQRPSKSPQRYNTSAHPSVSGTWGPGKVPPNDLEFLHTPYEEPREPVLKNKSSFGSIIIQQEPADISNMREISRQVVSTPEDVTSVGDLKGDSATLGDGIINDRPALKKKKSFRWLNKDTAGSDQPTYRSISMESSDSKQMLKRKSSLSTFLESLNPLHDRKEEYGTKLYKPISMDDQVKAVKEMESLKDNTLASDTTVTEMTLHSQLAGSGYSRPSQMFMSLKERGEISKDECTEQSFPLELKRATKNIPKKKPSKADLKMARIGDNKLEEARRCQLERAKARIDEKTGFTMPNQDTAEPCLLQSNTKEPSNRPACIRERSDLQSKDKNTMNYVQGQGRQAALAMGYLVRGDISSRQKSGPLTDPGAYSNSEFRSREHGTSRADFQGRNIAPKQTERSESMVRPRKANTPKLFYD